MATPVTGKLMKMRELATTITKMLGLLVCLYFFICSLSFLSDSFRILGGRNIGGLFSNSELLKNPVVGVMIGVLVTVLVQSSSTSTSIIVGLVSAGAPVREAIPMIMGANIGTSVTNIIVALTQAGEREQFRRAFACANVHDMFNWLSAFVLLITEVLTGYLEKVTGFIVDHMHETKTPDFHLPPISDQMYSMASSTMGSTIAPMTEPTVLPPTANPSPSSKTPDFLKVLTTPFTELVVQLDKKVLKGWATNDERFLNATSILRPGCHTNTTRCDYLLAYLGPEGANLGEVAVGVLLLVTSLLMLCSCLIGMVKILNSLLGPQVKHVIENVINADIPIRGLGWLTGYLAMLLGAIMTILVQSSSVFTSTLTPLAGAGLVSLERAYPMTLGSNLGTTTTSLLASFAAGGHHVKAANQIALVHMFFNLTGICLFYPVPWMRLPVRIARVLGATTATYRWFAVVYLAFMFFIFPSTMFLLSLAGPVPLYCVLVPLFTILMSVVTINQLQERWPQLLPPVLRTWTFLPSCLRSLEPWDRLVTKCLSCMGVCSCCQPKKEGMPDMVEKGRQRIRSGLSFCEEAPKRLRSGLSFSEDTVTFPAVAYNRLPLVPSAVSFTEERAHVTKAK